MDVVRLQNALEVENKSLLKDTELAIHRQEAETKKYQLLENEFEHVRKSRSECQQHLL